MNRRSFMSALFGTTAAVSVVPGYAVAGDAFKQKPATDDGLADDERAMLKELETRPIFLPSRKSILHTPEMWEKRRILKRLVHKNRVCIDFHVADGNSETDETCMVYFLPSAGKTPLDSYEK